MIVRIATEGQYSLGEEDTAGLNELDNAVVTACEGGDEGQFYATFAQLLDFVRSKGEPVDDDHLGGSDVILPPPGLSLEEARTEFTGEGLIPG